MRVWAHMQSEVPDMPIADSVTLGENVKVFHPSLVNLYGCTVGPDTKIGTFVEIQKGASIGARCKISSHTFICEGVVIEDEDRENEGDIIGGAEDITPEQVNYLSSWEEGT